MLSFSKKDKKSVMITFFDEKYVFLRKGFRRFLCSINIEQNARQNSPKLAENFRM